LRQLPPTRSKPTKSRHAGAKSSQSPLQSCDKTARGEHFSGDKMREVAKQLCDAEHRNAFPRLSICNPSSSVFDEAMLHIALLCFVTKL
jgi:hypothetical protein